MPTTINASASAGLITTADTSTILQLQTGGTTGLTVSAAQVVTLANPLPVASGGSGGTTSTGTGANVLGTTPSFTSTIGVGGATASASGAGITFPATQSASTDANTLDDYEEGTFTPTYLGSTTNPTVTYDAMTGGKYTKIGRMVFAYGSIRTDAVTGGSGALRLGGLPFTVASATGSKLDTRSGVIIGRSGGFNTDNPSSANTVEGETYCEVWYRTTANGGSTQSEITDLQNSADSNLIMFSVFYEAA